MLGRVGGRAGTFLGGGDMEHVLTAMGARRHRTFQGKDSTYSPAQKVMWAEGGEIAVFTVGSHPVWTESKGKHSTEKDVSMRPCSGCGRPGGF